MEFDPPADHICFLAALGTGRGTDSTKTVPAGTVVSITDEQIEAGYKVDSVSIKLEIEGGWYRWTSLECVHEYGPLELLADQAPE